MPIEAARPEKTREYGGTPKYGGAPYSQWCLFNHIEYNAMNLADSMGTTESMTQNQQRLSNDFQFVIYIGKSSVGSYLHPIPSHPRRQCAASLIRPALTTVFYYENPPGTTEGIFQFQLLAMSVGSAPEKRDSQRIPQPNDTFPLSPARRYSRSCAPFHVAPTPAPS